MASAVPPGDKNCLVSTTGAGTWMVVIQQALIDGKTIKSSVFIHQCTDELSARRYADKARQKGWLNVDVCYFQTVHSGPCSEPPAPP